MVTTPVSTRAIILAAGHGKRMRSEKPKVLHEILGKTILWRVLNTIDQLNVDQMHVVLGHGAEYIQNYLSEYSWNMPLSIHMQEPQLGTGHAVMQVLGGLQNYEGNLLITYGDTPLITLATLNNLLDVHSSKQADVSLITTEVDDPKEYGRILRSPQGEVIGIVEDKDASPQEKKIREINPGIYCLSFPKVLKGLKSLTNNNRQKEYYLTDLISWATNNGLKLASYVTPDWQELVGINSRLDLGQASRLLNQRTLRKLALEDGVTICDPESTWVCPEVRAEQDTIILPGCWLVGNITIGRSSVIGPDTSMEGNVDVGSNSRILRSHVENSQIGSNCKIGPFAHLRDGAVLSDQVRIGNFVELKKTFMGLASKASHLSYVGDTTVGNDANIGAGTITANYNHLTKVKASTVIGDGASTGSNSVLVAPVSLGAGSMVAAGTVVTKDVPPGALSVRRAPQENIEGWCDTQKRKAKAQNPGKQAKKKAEKPAN
jgi:bifunctional UDP-N-acetylglucosamine pyrophosphorylase/glucosamine-1-phosphate N-acetyltransferase